MPADAPSHESPQLACVAAKECFQKRRFARGHRKATGPSALGGTRILILVAGILTRGPSRNRCGKLSQAISAASLSCIAWLVYFVRNTDKCRDVRDRERTYCARDLAFRQCSESSCISTYTPVARPILGTRPFGACAPFRSRRNRPALRRKARARGEYPSASEAGRGRRRPCLARRGRSATFLRSRRFFHNLSAMSAGSATGQIAARQFVAAFNAGGCDNLSHVQGRSRLLCLPGLKDRKCEYREAGMERKAAPEGAAIRRGGERRVSGPLNLKDARIFHYVPGPYAVASRWGYAQLRLPS